MTDSLHELNQDAWLDQQEIDFRAWTQDAEEMQAVFPSLKQVRIEMLSEKGRIKFTSRMCDYMERSLDDKLFDRKN